ncbi:MAG TPA: glutaminyl-peptide cyclotransferase [Candidatus Acidoferrales bacterium]|nr:glutaminyl-peptide cyclotransferase [Candidatus Acidoferrales bacterium]
MKPASSLLRSCASGLALALLLLAGCDSRLPAAPGTVSMLRPRPDTTNAVAGGYPLYSYDVVRVWPHDRNAFTQGLVYWDGGLLESTGLNGESSLRRVELQTGKVLQRVDVPSQYFAEGLALLNGKLFQLTWQSHLGFVYDLATLKQEKEFTYPGEGWGLTTDGTWLIMSDGTDQIRFLDPATFKENRRITVIAHGNGVSRLNELEYIQGEIYANVWGTDFVVVIDPATGKVTGVIDFTGLLPAQDRDPNTDVLNGIAYDAAGNRLFVTGKRWPKLFEVSLKLKS